MVFEVADFLDLDSYHVARLEPFGGIHRGSHAAGGAGRNDRPRQQGKDRRQRLDLCEAIEDQMPGIGMLARFAVDEGAQVKPVRIANLVRVRSAKGGARFGAIFGSALGVAGAIGWFSVVPLGPGYLASVAVCQIIENMVAGALAGMAIESGRVLRIVVISTIILVAGIAAGIAVQATGLAPGGAA